MTTDDDMDDLLRAAGQRWRAANASELPTVDFAAVTPTPGGQPRRQHWLVMASAAIVVAAVAIGGTWLGTHRTRDHTGVATPAGGTGGTTKWGGLVGTDWTIFEVTTDTATSSDSTGMTGSAAYLQIRSGGSFTGSDGCNPISGTVQITGTTLSFGAVYVGAAGCLDPGVMEAAAKVDAILQGTVTWTIGDAGGANDLSIVHAGVGSLIYFGTKPPSPVTDPSAAVGTWALTEYDQTNSTGEGSATGSGASGGFGDKLVVDADGTFKVQDRCYANVGKVVFGDGTATWSDVHLAGAIPCPATTDQQDEQRRNALVDGVLTGRTTWKIDYGQLRITKGGTTIVYSPYAADTGPSDAPTT